LRFALLQLGSKSIADAKKHCQKRDTQGAFIMIAAITAIVWMVASFIVGLFSARRALGFWGGFFFSVLLSPVIMILILMLTKQLPKRPRG
jgi:hypothetical protein